MNTSLSRRGFAKVLGAGAAYAALNPSFARTLPGLSLVKTAAPAVVRLNSNENPYGPSPLAVKAMTDAMSLAWRYPDEHADVLINALAKLHGVPASHILLGDGSGEILKLAAAAFTGPERRLVAAFPVFEAILSHVVVTGAPVLRAALTETYAHDLTKMLAQGKEGSLFYICNPNNPTASITPKDELNQFIANVPHSMVLVDEAYHHYVESKDYESVIPLVTKYPNLIVARTFSKVYSMAGLRCGYCVAQPEMIQRMNAQQTWDSVNIMALVAAAASLEDPNQVEQGRRRNTEVKQYVYSELDKLGYKYIPSHANFLMIDLRRRLEPVRDEMRKRNVQVGRLFPAMPNHMRVTIGTRPQMEAFVSAFKAVMN